MKVAAVEVYTAADEKHNLNPTRNCEVLWQMKIWENEKYSM